MEKFKRIVSVSSKVLIGITILLLAVMIVMAATSKSEEIIVPTAFGLVCIIDLVLLFIVYLIMFVFHLIKVVKKGHYGELIEMLVGIPVMAVVIVISSKLMDSDNLEITTAVAMAIIMSMGSFAHKFWKDKYEE